MASEVASRLAERGESLRWLSEQSGIGYATLRSRMSVRSDFTVTELAAIAGALDISPVSLVPPSGSTR